jgi:hypothetical protein
MISKLLAPLALLCAMAAPLVAAPTFAVIPQGQQAGNWVWDVQITPDLAIAGGGTTPLAVEMGFRLAGDPLVSVTNLSPLVFDTNNPGLPIFGWEVKYGIPPFPEGIEANCTGCTVLNPAIFGGHAATVVPGSANEVFTALGSIDISVPGSIPFLRIVAQGPGTGGPLISTIQWLGAYSGQGKISQSVGISTQDFFFSGTATQAVPEPGCAMIVLGFSAISAVFGCGRRPHRNLA